MKKQKLRKPKVRARKKMHGRDHALILRINRQMPGLRMEWFDSDPLSQNPINVNDVIVSHKAKGCYAAREFWSSNSIYIRSKSRWKWRIKMLSVFEWDVSDQHEVRIIEDSFVLEDMADRVESAIKDAIKHGEKERFVGTHFTIECVGNPDAHKHDVDAELKQAFELMEGCTA